MMNRPVGRPVEPVKMPEIPQQECPDEDLTWYIVTAQPGQCWKATERLRDKHDIAAWCPIGTVERRRNRRTIIVWGPLLPPYLFAGLRPDQGVARVRDAIGVAGLSCSDGGKPQTIKADVLVRLWQRCQNSETPGALSRLPVSRGPWAAQLQSGEKLLISDGPMLGTEATFSGFEDGKLKIEVYILGRPVLTTISPNLVIRAK